MPLIELTWEEYKKVFWDIVEVGPITQLPERHFIVRPAHLQFLDEKGVHYTVKDWKTTMARLNGRRQRQP